MGTSNLPATGAITATRQPRDGRWRDDKQTTLRAAVAAAVFDRRNDRARRHGALPQPGGRGGR